MEQSCASGSSTIIRYRHCDCLVICATEFRKALGRERSSSRERGRPHKDGSPEASRRSRSRSRSVHRSTKDRRYTRSRSRSRRRSRSHSRHRRRGSRDLSSEPDSSAEQFVRTVAIQVKEHGTDFEKNLLEREYNNPKYSFLRHDRVSDYRPLLIPSNLRERSLGSIASTSLS